MRRPAILLALTTGLILVAGAPAASAHPLGNFTVNRYAGIVVSGGEVVVDYVLDLAEIPAFQEQPSIDGDGDGVEPAELQAWSADRATAIAEGLMLRVNDRALSLDVRRSSATMRSGQGGLATVRLEATFGASVRIRSGRLSFEDRNDPGRLGWREITASGIDGIALVGPTVPPTSRSDRLRAYPQDLLASPLSVTSMEAAFRPGSSDLPAAAISSVRGRPFVDGGRFVGLIGTTGAPLMALGLVLAVGLGAWHALLPGHGKTLMAAAMAGSSARTRQAVVAGVCVALMHTVSVIAVGLAVLVLERTFRPESVYPLLGFASGAVAAAIGVHLIRHRRRSWHHDDHHPHRHAVPTGDLLTARGIGALAFAGGILPAPSALIVLLASIQGHRTAFGLALVLSFSLGLAAALIVVGLGAMRAREVIRGRLSERLGRLVSLGTAGAIVLVGATVAIRSVASI